MSRILYNIWAHLHIILYFVKIFPPCTMMNFWVILPNNIQFYLINNNIIFIFIIIGQHQGEFDASQIWSGQPECEPWRTHTTEMWSFFSIFELYQREWNRFKIYLTIPKFLHGIRATIHSYPFSNYYYRLYFCPHNWISLSARPCLINPAWYWYTVNKNWLQAIPDRHKGFRLASDNSCTNV